MLADEKKSSSVFLIGHERRLSFFEILCVYKMEENLDSSQSIKWDESEILGRGCQGTVVFAGHFNRHPVAVKRILLTNTQLVQRELEALIDCRGHPRILHLYHVEKDSQFL